VNYHDRYGWKGRVIAALTLNFGTRWGMEGQGQTLVALPLG